MLKFDIFFSVFTGFLEESNAVAFKLNASFHLPHHGWFGFATDFNEIIRFRERCLDVGEGKCSARAARAAPVH